MSEAMDAIPQWVEALEKLGLPVEANMADLLNRAIIANGDDLAFLRLLSTWSVARRAMRAAEWYRKAVIVPVADPGEVSTVNQEQIYAEA